LHKLMVIKQYYCPRLIQQFFATLEFDSQDHIGFTWMTDEVRGSLLSLALGRSWGTTLLVLTLVLVTGCILTPPSTT
jgi:hypothetical protein